MALAGEVEPAAQPKPGGALQSPEHPGEGRPGALPNTPAGQRLQVAAPAAEKAPGGHCTQVALEAAPVAALAVPAGQGAQVSWRTRWLPNSAAKSTPAGETPINMGVLNAAAVP